MSLCAAHDAPELFRHESRADIRDRGDNQRGGEQTHRRRLERQSGEALAAHYGRENKMPREGAANSRTAWRREHITSP